jgi:hypothetical protein
MPSDYDFSMPAFGSSTSDTSGWSSNNYSLSDSSPSSWGGGQSASFGSDKDTFDFTSSEWYVDSTKTDTSGQGGESSWLGDAAGGVWDWLKSPQGTSVAAGAIKGLMGVWGADMANQMKGKPAEPDHYEADLKDARVKAHNASINKPMNMGLINFKR